MTGRARMVSNLLSLYGVQLATLALPLVTLPFLSRVLGPTAWGQLAAVQALGLTLSLVIEYGFAYSATRAVAAHQDRPDLIAQAAQQVLSARLVLTALAALAGALIFILSSPFREEPLLFLFGLLYAASRGFTPLWYYQGIEDMRLAAVIDMAMKALAAALIFLLVRLPEQAWLVLALQACTILIGQWLNTARMYRSIPYSPPTLWAAAAGLRAGWSMFLFRGSVGLYTTANAAILRVFVPGSAVSYYAGAEQLTNAAKSLIQPISQLIFPRMSYLARHDSLFAATLARRTLVLLTAVMSGIAMIAFLTAPAFIPWFFGGDYVKSTSIFQWLCLTLPLTTISGVLGIQWMLPLGMDRAFNTIIISGGIINIVLVSLLTLRMGLYGAVYSIIITEAIIAITMVLYLYKKTPQIFYLGVPKNFEMARIAGDKK
ncbi:oligosaccharide flippase family protein [Deinococcus sp. SDU3-2]|uniref:Oligosaccharide flippase family protein n=1 Tax=Deinococcus terrestris TaxID=2651870 RepID=A0A7X1NXH2_9DEIO|nr:oligosaccharide flippase family protein [Deinococcus terrestris]MPY67636.1 oligosaccharide flippase family protein [Deinococcus terrestris]